MQTTDEASVIPAELRSLSQWLTWSDVDGKKVPNGKSNDPTTWSDFERLEIFDNVAFVFSPDDPYTGIDLDGCIVDGAWTAWSLPILDRFRGIAYGEISPSGTGIKLITRAAKPEGTKCVHKFGEDKQQVECYDNRRFWTITKNVQQGFEAIGDGQDAVDWLCAEYLTARAAAPISCQSSLAIRSTDKLTRASKYLAKIDPAIQFQGGDRQTFIAACAMIMGFDLSVSEAFNLLHDEYNPRCVPPWSEQELVHKVRSADALPGDRGRLLTDTSGVDLSQFMRSSGEQIGPIGPGYQKGNSFVSDNQAEQSAVISAVGIGLLIDSHPNMRPPVVDGVVRRGETANIIAAAKVGKSFLASGLAWSVATGEPWLSHDVVKGRVLIIDNELHPETLAHRLYRVAMDMMIDLTEHGEAIDVISLRGQNIDIHSLQSRLATIQPGTYALCIVDALYRTLPAGTNENDNSAMMAIYNRLDHYAHEWDCAIAVVHHASKGQQGDKSITDVGAGAGSISRAADTHLVIRPHEDPELSVLECVTRSFKSPEPVSVRFEWPLWHSVSVEAEVKKANRQSKEQQAKADKEDTAALLAKVPEAPKSVQQNKLFEQFEFGVGKAKRLIGKLVRSEHVKIVRKRRRGSQKTLIFYVRLKSSSESSSDSDSDSF